MEEELDYIESEAYRKERLGTISLGMNIVKSIKMTYSKFKEATLLGVKGEASEDWIVILYGDYLFDAGRFKICFTPSVWLETYASESWSIEKYKKAIQPLK